MSPPGRKRKILRTPPRSEWPGSSSVTVWRRSLRLVATFAWASPPCPLAPASAAAGRSSIRFETWLDSRTSRSPMEVIEAIFRLNSGLRTSTDTRSATNAAAFC